MNFNNRHSLTCIFEVGTDQEKEASREIAADKN